MGTIKNLRDRVSRINLRTQLPILIEQTKETIIDLNQQQLYLFGEDAKGVKLDPYRSVTYAAQKFRMNPEPGEGTPDLFLTGAFYRGFFVRVTPQTFGVDSRDSKSAELKNKYGETIFGLQRDSKQQYIQQALWIAVKNYIQFTSGLRMR